MKQVALVEINRKRHNKAIFLNGELLITANSGAQDSLDVIERVARSLALLNCVDVTRIALSPEDHWEWHTIRSKLKDSGDLVCDLADYAALGGYSALIRASLLHLKESIKSRTNLDHLSGIIDIEQVTEEVIDPLLNLQDSEEHPNSHYSVIAFNFSHLTNNDRSYLTDSATRGDDMVLCRPTGFYIRLFECDARMNYRPGYSESLNDIIRWSYQNGYRMIEFDSGAEVMRPFPVYA
ncbi:MAG: hypothetical protein G8D89_21545 [gamma proteobacterium symbiont of Clathrolucina costata]